MYYVSHTCVSCYNPRHANLPRPYPAKNSSIHIWIGTLPHVNVTAPRCGEPFLFLDDRHQTKDFRPNDQ